MERHSRRRFYGRPIFKGALFASTALVLPALAPRLAFAQIAPGTTPQNGVVVGGAASITQAPASTTINQTSQRAAIDWQSFDVGSNAKVQFNQPDASAIALNRVTGGNLSQINGQINANGQIILINQSGVVFGKGAQVNAESVVVSTSDVATSDFMAGKMNFSGAPKPGAQIVNNGQITARDAGLVGLVAPQVANNGVITAQLGRVVLAGASAFTLDLYGDRLISLDVTQAVRAVDVNGQTVSALVTNNGIIIADGGSITLTAQDADALVTQLIDAGGTLRANSSGAQTGTISLSGIGGNIHIAGNLLTQGIQPGSHGGSIQALTDGTVAVDSTADIDASGEAGGGIIALGTDLTRAKTGPADISAPAAASVTIAQGAAIHADATSLGNGGTITLLSQNVTGFDGAITARGGPLGGNGGLAEISSRGVIDLGGTVLETAIDGQAGEILLDPATLYVESGQTTIGPTSTAGGTTVFGGAGGGASYVDPTELNSLTGTVDLQASSLIEVLDDVNLTSASALTLNSGGDVSVLAFISLAGSLEIDAAGSLYIGPGITDVSIPILGTLLYPSFTSTGGLDAGSISLKGDAGIEIDAPLMAPGSVQLQSAGGPILSGSRIGYIGAREVEQITVAGSIQTALLTGGPTIIGGLVSLTNTGNAVSTLANVAAIGTIDLYDAAPLTIAGGVSAAVASIAANGFDITGFLDVPSVLTLQTGFGAITEAPAATIDTGLLAISSSVGSNDSLAGTANLIGTLAAIRIADSISSLFLADAETLNLPNRVTIGNAFTFSGAGGAGLTESGAGLLKVPQFIAAGTIGGIDLGGGNMITDIGATAAGAVTINNETSLTDLTSIIGSNVFITIATIGGALDFADSTTGITATGAGGTLSVTAEQLDLTSNGLFSAPTGTIALAPYTATDGIVVDTGGTGGANTLALTDAFIQALGTSARAVELGDGTMSGTISLGATSADTANLGTAALDLRTTGSIDEIGTLTAATLAFNAAAFNEDVAGTIAANLVTGTAGTGGVSLGSPFNVIGTLGGVSAAGNIAIDDALAGSLMLDGVLTTAGTIALGNELGGLDEITGVIDAGTLTTGPFGLAGAADLGNANQIGDLADIFGGSNNLLLNDAQRLAINGVVQAGLLTLQDSAGGISQTGAGYIQAATLSSGGSEISGNVVLGGANQIGTVANLLLAAGDSIYLYDPATTLNVAGTLAAANITLNALQISLTSGISAVGSLELNSQTGIFQTGGGITAGTLGGAVARAGDISLTATANNFGKIGNVSLYSGNVLLTDLRALDILGTLATPDALILSVTSIGETGAGLIDAGTLDNEVQLSGLSLGGANTISVLSGNFSLASGGDFYLIDQPALTLATEIAGTGVTFGGGGLTESPTGFIDAATLSGAGTIGGNMLLTNPGNTIGVLDRLALTGTLDLADAGNLGLGTLSAAAATFSNATGNGDLNIFGAVSVAGALELDFADGIYTGTGAINAATLESAGITAQSVSLTGTNSIATLGAFTALGDFQLNDLIVLDIGGALTAQDIALTAPALLLNSAVTAGALAAPGTLAVITDAVTAGPAGLLDAPNGTIEIAPRTYTTIDIGGLRANELDLPGTIFGLDAARIIVGAAIGSQATSIVIDAGSFGTALVDLSATNGITDFGTLAAGTVAFNGGGFAQGGPTAAILATLLAADAPITGPVALTGTLNQIGALGPVTVTGGQNFALTDQAYLNVTGAVLAQNITLDDLVAIALGAPVSVASNGTIQIASNALTTLAATAAPITAPGDAGTVILSPYTPGDSVGIDLGGTSTGGLQLSNALLQLIGAGLLRIGTLGGGQITSEGSVSISPNELRLTGNSFNFAGTLAGPTLLSLAATGFITESAAAAIDFATIAGAGAGAGAGLIGGNTIGTIGNFSAAGDIILNDLATLVIDGLVSASGSISLEGMSFRETGPGALDATLLTSGGTTIGGNAVLTGANAIGEISNFYLTSGATLAFNDTEPLTVGGTVVADNDSLAAGTIDFTGNLTATNLLALSSSFVTQSSGVITAGTLSSLGSVAGNVVLSGANQIGTLANFSVGGGDTLALTDARALTLAGTDIAPTASLTAAGMAFLGAFSAANALVLSSSAAVSQTSGTIITGTLATAGPIGGALTLLDGNLIGTLGPIGATGNIAIGNAEFLNIGGLVSTPHAITLETTAGVTELPGGTLAAAALNSGGQDIGGDVFLTNANSITTLADFSVTTGHTLAFADAGSLTLAGTIAASAATLAGNLLDFTGSIVIPGNLAVASAGNVTQASGVITAGTLTSQSTIGGNVLLPGANTIGTIGAFTIAAGRTLALNDTGLLTIAGPVSAPNATFAAGTIDVSGMVTSTLLALASGTGITQTGGTIAAGTLTSGGTTIGGDIDLPDANAIATLANIYLTAGANLRLTDATALTLAGSIFASEEDFVAQSIDFEGLITASNLLALASSGPITQGAGTIQAPTLTSLGSINGNVTLTAPNAIGTLTNFSVGAGDSLALTDATPLTLSGTVSAPSATLTASSLAVAGSVQSTLLALISAGGISETGAITAGTITSLGSTDGSALLTGSNHIGTVGVFAVGPGQNFVLDDTGLLTVAGPLTGPVIGLFASTIAIPGMVSAGTLLALDATGNIFETGILTAPTLTSAGATIGGAESLGGANTIGTIGNLALDGNFALTNTGTLTIAGTLQTPNADITLADNASVTEITGGSLLAGTLDTGGTTLGGNLLLAGANSIGTLGAITLGTGLTFDLADRGLLNIAGTVFAPTAALSSGSIAIAGALDGTLLALASAGTIAETSGTIAVATLTGLGTIGGNANFTNGNLIGTLTNLTMASGASLALTDLEALVLAGTIIAPNAVLTAPTLGFDGAFAAGNVLALTGASLVTEGPAGAITAGTITSRGSADGNIFLTGIANTIATIANLTVGAGDTFALDDTGLLTVAGPLAGPVIALSSSGIAIPGAITATQLALESTGTISETTGTIFATTLTSGGITIGGDLSLLNGNTIGTLGNITAAGNVALANTGTLAIAGTLQTPQAVTLEDNNAIFETTGQIQAATLNSGNATIGGDADFTGAANTIANLGNLTLAAGHTLVLDDTGLLTVAGTVFAPTATFTMGTLAIAGALDDTFLALAGIGTVSETTGTIATATLSSGGGTDGTVTLLQTNNIGTLGAFTAIGDFTLNDGAPLAVAGLITTAATITLEDAGNITEIAGGTLDSAQLTSGGTTIGGAVALLNANTIGQIGGFAAAGNIGFDNAESYAVTGQLATPGTLSLAGAGLSEAGGAISAATLATIGTLAGGATFNGANTITSLGTFNAATDLLLADNAPLTLAGHIGLGGTLGLLDTSNILQTAGGITAMALTSDGGTIGGGFTLNAANSIATLGAFNAALGLALNDLVALSIAGPVNLGGTLAIADTANVGQAASTIAAAAISSDGGSIGGTALFNQPGNQIAALSAITAAGGLSVTDARDLSLIGRIDTGAAPLDLTDSGFAISQTSGTILTGTLNAHAAGITLPNANGIATLGLVSAGYLLANGVAAIAGPVTAQTATITSPATLLLDGTISTSGNLLLSSTGNLTQTSGVFAASNATLLSLGMVDLAGSGGATGALFVNSAGSFASSGNLTGATINLASDSYLSQTAGAITGGSISMFGNRGVGVSGAVAAAGHLDITSQGRIDDEAISLTAASADLTSSGAGISLNGHNSVAGLLTVTGAGIYQTSGLIQAGTANITGNTSFIELNSQLSAQAVTLTGPSTGGSGIMLGGGISVAGALALQSATEIAQTGGTINAGTITALTAGNIILDGALTDAGALNLSAGGLITQNSSPLTAATASLTAAGVTLAGADNFGAGLTITANNFNQTQGSISAAYANISAATYLGVNGAVSIASSLNLTARDTLVDAATSLDAATASLFAPQGNIILDGNNTVLNPLLVSAAAGITQTAGTILAPAATFTAGGNIDLAGNLSVTTELDLIAGGDIFHSTGGTLIAGTLAGSGAQLAQFTAPTDFATIGSFILQDSTFVLDNASPLTIVGPLAANAVSITAPGLVTLLGAPAGGLFIAGNIEPKTVLTPQPGDSVITVTQGPGGAAPAIVQTGTFYIDAGPLAADFPAFANQPATLFLQTLPDGTINFAPSPPATNGLDAPSIDLSVALGNGGTVSGNVNLQTVLIVSGTASQFTGTLDGVTGSAASAKGSVSPFAKPAFQFNACPIGSVNCIILPVETLPTGNPLQNFDIEERKRKRLDKNVALPGVAMRDF